MTKPTAFCVARNGLVLKSKHKVGCFALRIPARPTAAAKKISHQGAKPRTIAKSFLNRQEAKFAKEPFWVLQDF